MKAVAALAFCTVNILAVLTLPPQETTPKPQAHCQCEKCKRYPYDIYYFPMQKSFLTPIDEKSIEGYCDLTSIIDAKVIQEWGAEIAKSTPSSTPVKQGAIRLKVVKEGKAVLVLDRYLNAEWEGKNYTITRELFDKIRFHIDFSVSHSELFFSPKR